MSFEDQCSASGNPKADHALGEKYAQRIRQTDGGSLLFPDHAP